VDGGVAVLSSRFGVGLSERKEKELRMENGTIVNVD
jgi:hypothetical protein